VQASVVQASRLLKCLLLTDVTHRKESKKVSSIYQIASEESQVRIPRNDRHEPILSLRRSEATVAIS